MGIASCVLIVLAAGAADPREGLSRPRARVAAQGGVQQGVFSADGKAFLGWVSPVRKDPAAERQKPQAWTLWAVADGKEVARWTGGTSPGLDMPGTADGTVWPAYLSEPPTFFTRCRLLDLTTGKVGDVPGLTGPKDSCTRPSFSADRTRLAYSDYAEDANRRTGRVYEKKAAGWVRVAEVPGEHATLSPDGTLVATVGWNGDRSNLIARLFTVADGKEKWFATVDSYGLHGFTPDGRYLIQADNAGHRLFDVATGKQNLLLANGVRGSNHGPAEVAYRAGWVAAVVRGEKAVELVRWDAAGGKEVSRTAVECPYGRNRTPAFGSPLLAVVRPSETHAVPGQRGVTWSSTAADVYDPAAAEPAAKLVLGSPGSVIASPDGGTLASVGSLSLLFLPLPVPK